MSPAAGEDNRITILYMIDTYHGAGGTERHLYHLALGLDKSRYRPLVLTFHLWDNPLAREMQQKGVPVIDFPLGRYYTPVALRKLAALAGLIREQRAQIVQTYHFKSDTFGALAARLAGVRTIISSRRDMGDLKSGWHVFLSRRCNSLFKGFIVVADTVGRSLQKKERVPANLIKTLYNGVDTTRYRTPTDLERQEAREELGIRPEEFVVGTVAWFRPEKNHALLLEALESLHQVIPGMRLLWIGGWPVEGRSLVDDLRDEVNRRGLEDRVIFAGIKDDVRKYLMCCDVAALVPSGNEGFSNAIIEKMAMGLPLVVTDVGGNAEAVVDGYNGMVIRSGDVQGLVEALRELHRNRDLRRLMGQRSRERAEKVFPLQAMVSQHDEYYQSFVRSDQ